MSIEQVIEILDRHSVPCREWNGSVIAEDSWTYRDADGNVQSDSEWIEIDREDIEALKAFLGY